MRSASRACRHPARLVQVAQRRHEGLSGVARRSILAIASQLEAQLIVMGVPERKERRPLIMASTAMPVLASGRTPSLNVRLTSGRDVSRATVHRQSHST